MNRIEEMYEGDFLKADDLPEGALATVVIESVADPFAEKDAAGKEIKKAILAFKDRHKRMIINKTNYRILKTMFGGPDKWIGQTIHLQRRYLDAAHAFGVQNEMCIRIIPPDGTPLPKGVRDYMGRRQPTTTSN